MRTQCPACKSVFRVTHQQLSTAGGRVRCGRCNTVFDGNENIKYTKPPVVTVTPAQPVRARQDAAADGGHRRSVVAPRDTPPAQLDPKATTRAPPDRSADMASGEPPAVPASFFPGSRAYGKRRARRYTMIGVIVSLLLLAGYAYHERERLAASPLVTDWMARACRYIGCEVPSRRAPDQIKIVDREVTSSPARRDTLRVTATLVNKAPRAQPYPRMRVALTNLQGTVVAVNRFEPADYLPPDIRPDALMTPDERIDIRVEVPDPGVNAVAFEFSFY
ncbi:MAG: DUF3426 domain-containing protein [Gammaproteobacteria bacterium]